MRYTRQLASTALIVAAGLGMGACSAHPGAAVITSSGVTYSNAEIKEAAQELFDMKLTKSVDTEYGIRTSLMNSEALAAAGASVGITVTDEQVDTVIAQDVAQAGGVVPAKMGRATRAVFESETIRFRSIRRLERSHPPPWSRLRRVPVPSSIRVSFSLPSAEPTDRRSHCTETQSPLRRTPTCPR